MYQQEYLSQVVNRLIIPNSWPTLRGIQGFWKNQTLYLNFFFNKEISEELKEEVSVFATEILAQFSDGLIEENYLVIGDIDPLPESQFWVYRRL